MVQLVSVVLSLLCHSSFKGKLGSDLWQMRPDTGTLTGPKATKPVARMILWCHHWAEPGNQISIDLKFPSTGGSPSEHVLSLALAKHDPKTGRPKSWVRRQLRSTPCKAVARGEASRRLSRLPPSPRRTGLGCSKQEGSSPHQG